MMTKWNLLMLFDLDHDSNQLVIYVLTLLMKFLMVHSMMMMMKMMKVKIQLLIYDDCHLDVLNPLRKIYYDLLKRQGIHYT